MLKSSHHTCMANVDESEIVPDARKRKTSATEATSALRCNVCI